MLKYLKVKKNKNSGHLRFLHCNSVGRVWTIEKNLFIIRYNVLGTRGGKEFFAKACRGAGE